MSNTLLHSIGVAVVLAFTTNSISISAAEPSIAIELGEQQRIELVLIPKGKFLQGSPENEPGREPDEALHEVELSSDFYLAKFPVTVGQFRQFVTETGYRTEAEVGTSGGYGLVGENLEQRPDFNWQNPGYEQSDEHPVTIVTVKDAVAFTQWLSRKADRKMILPSEAQWEYACRAGTTTRFYSGDADEDLDQIGWYKLNAPTGAAAVGKKSRNAFGLYDMSGNIYEWCADIYATYPTTAARDPQQRVAPSGETTRVVLRGGSYTRLAKRCRSAARYRATPGTRNAENGFRVASLQLVATTQPMADTAPPPSSMIVDAPSSPAESGSPEQSPVPAETSAPAAIPSFPTGNGASAPGNGILGLLCPLAALVAVVTAIAAVITKIVRKPIASAAPQSVMRGATRFPAKAAATASAASTALFEVTNDGFWLNTTAYAVGATIHYHYLFQGQRFDTNCVVVSPDRQFVYTGVQPDEIVIDYVEDEAELDELGRPTGSLPPGSDDRDGTFSNPEPFLNDQDSGDGGSDRDDEGPFVPSDDDSASTFETRTDSFGSSFPPAY